MYLHYLFLVCLLQYVSARSVSIWGDAPASEPQYPVPGNNPMAFCSAADTTDDILKLARVDLLPNPPEKGKNLSITADGVFTRDIEQGAYVKLTVKFGLITILKTQADLCEQLDQVDLSCPLQKGPYKITKEVELPKEIPKGKYSVRADVYTNDDEHITCLDAKVQFG